MSKLIRVDDDTYDLLDIHRKRKQTFDQVIWDILQDIPEDEDED
jgi:hypothetical protein